MTTGADGRADTRDAGTPSPRPVLPARPLTPAQARTPLLDVRAVASYANVSEKLVRLEVARGALVARRLGRLLRFRPADVETWIDRAAVGGWRAGSHDRP